MLCRPACVCVDMDAASGAPSVWRVDGETRLHVASLCPMLCPFERGSVWCRNWSVLNLLSGVWMLEIEYNARASGVLVKSCWSGVCKPVVRGDWRVVCVRVGELRERVSVRMCSYCSARPGGWPRQRVITDGSYFLQDSPAHE